MSLVFTHAVCLKGHVCSGVKRSLLPPNSTVPLCARRRQSKPLSGMRPRLITTNNALLYDAHPPRSEQHLRYCRVRVILQVNVKAGRGGWGDGLDPGARVKMTASGARSIRRTNKKKCHRCMRKITAAAAAAGKKGGSIQD